MPSDEIGEIMRSRNRSIVSLRRHERELARALSQLEEVATDLKRKNHLLEMARRNLADADRLASLGIMSAGLAHELNTPLAVLKGLAEKIALAAGRAAPSGANGRAAEVLPGVSVAEAQLMLRVVGRLEKLGESLLDFARVRPATMTPTELRTLVDEAWTLVALDRHAARIAVENDVPAGLMAECDAARIMQVLVNLLRNAVDAMDAQPAAEAAPPPRIEVRATTVERDRREWVSLTIADNGPGIDPDVLARMFEPFVSTRLDAHGTGLGLAVSEGIIKEHGGLLMARNRNDGPVSGAVFEMLLPARGLRNEPPQTAAPPHLAASTEQPVD
jgi:two-component system C4-dicarboxylate transport sensor histidine kinase DctB